MIIKNGKVITAYGTFADSDVLIEGKKIVALAPRGTLCEDGQKVYDAAGKFVSPGFFDIHIHGGNGFTYYCGDKQTIIDSTRYYSALSGATAIMPTVSIKSQGPDKGMDALNDVWLHDNDTGAELIGIHLEGPFMDHGGSCPDIDLAKDRVLLETYPCVKRWTLPPERPHGLELVDLCVEMGVQPSVGHCKADYEDAVRANEHGARMITHIYGSMSSAYRNGPDRYAGLVEACFLLDDYYVGFTANGRQLNEAMCRMILKICGANRLFLGSDSHPVLKDNTKEYPKMETGFPPDGSPCKAYAIAADYGDGKGVCHIHSVMPIGIMVKFLIRDCGISIHDAVRMATLTPAEAMKVSHRKGKLQAGYDADIVVFDDNVDLKLVVARGEIMRDEL